MATDDPDRTTSASPDRRRAIGRRSLLVAATAATAVAATAATSGAAYGEALRTEQPRRAVRRRRRGR